ncbi:hypothetical protein AVEN_153483-1 [Araneus ventricosus]|uniref:Retrotransposon gag domain-containing protein n=1 Tax=Araneus ventricosus TaxID=182803 RepID=A0A4Y2K5W2_ARAVE|nr:hypothetical protein AVEN_153483-1 [Araneus ventricosus]
MPDSKETAPKLPDDTRSVPVSIAPVPILTYQLPRNSCNFAGDFQQDVNKWLKDFQRIATYNHWDDQMCMANVIFYLAGTARQWFDNNEDTFSNFTTFKNSLNNAFCLTYDLQRQAERLLLTRTQQFGQTSESYIQDALSLCRKANPSLSEDEKVAHLMKGIAEGLYQSLLVQDCREVDEFVKGCREIESLRRRRITRKRFQRLPNVSAVCAETDATCARGEAASEENPPTYITTELEKNTTHITVKRQCVKALVDSGVDYYVISEELRRQLNAPMFSETGHTLKTACGKPVAALGRCVLKVNLNGTVKPFEFLVFIHFSHQMILGWDFFRATNPIKLEQKFCL